MLWQHVYRQPFWVKGVKLNFCFGVTSVEMAEANPSSVSLDGVSAQWESDKDLRQLVRSTGSLFCPMDGKLSLETNVDCVGCNYLGLLPVMAKLLEPVSAVLGMVSIPTAEAELLSIEHSCRAVASSFLKCPNFKGLNTFP